MQQSALQEGFMHLVVHNVCSATVVGKKLFQKAEFVAPKYTGVLEE